MDYQFLLPSKGLRPYVQFYGVLQQTPGSGRVSTDGWVAPYLGKGLVFVLHRDGDLWVSNDHFDQPAPSGYFLPQCTQRFRLRMEGAVRVLAVVFRPGQFRRLFRLPGGDLMDRQVLTFQTANLCSLLDLQEQLREPEAIAIKLSRIETYLYGRLAQNDCPYTLVDVALRQLQAQPVHGSLRQLSGDLACSERYLRKVFQRDIGIGIKTFQRILRFNQAFQMIKSGRYTKLSDVAYSLGYFDQSHFNREFREFMGVAPKQFLRESHPLQNQLYWR